MKLTLTFLKLDRNLDYGSCSQIDMKLKHEKLSDSPNVVVLIVVRFCFENR